MKAIHEGMKTIIINQTKLVQSPTYQQCSVLLTMTGHAIQTSLILLVSLCSHVAATTFEVTKFYHSWSNVKFGGAESCVTDSDIANRTGIGNNFMDVLYAS